MKNRWYPAANRDAKVEWDFEDRLVKVTKSDGTVVENVYDVDGVLVRTAVNGVGTDYLVDTSGGLSHVVAEVDGSGAVAVLYVRAGDMLLEEIRGGVAKMYEADGLGSVRGLLDVSGAKTDTYSYEAFGSTLSSTGSDANPYRFAGERLVDSVGFYQNRERWLDTSAGRFASVDPKGGKARLPTTFNPYLYSGSSPVSFVDPTGGETLVSIGVTLAVSAIVWGAVWAGSQYSGNAARVNGIPRESLAEMHKYPEIRIVWGDVGAEKDFDFGVADLVRYWWKNIDGHDVWAAAQNAATFRNHSYGLSQDIRVCAAERYLMGLSQSKEWGAEKYKFGEVWGYDNIKSLHPWWSPAMGFYPPSPWSWKASNWYDQGLDGIGGQYGVVPNVDCWRIKVGGQYWNLQYGPGVGNGNVNPSCGS